MKIITLAVCLVLVGCGGTTSDLLVPDSTKSFKISKELLQPCQEPSALVDGSDKANLDFATSNLNKLAECALKSKEQATILRKVFNLEEGKP